MIRIRQDNTVIAASLLLAAILFGLAAHKPLHLDNMDFPAVAQATAQSWKPVYYRGEENPAHLGLYHPPLYIYCLAGWMKVYGPSPAAVRYFGFASLLLQGLIVLQLIRAAFGRALERRVRAWFWFVFLLNSYTLQTASIADIDSTVYGPILCSILLVAIRMYWGDGQRRTSEPGLNEVLLLSALIVLAFWAKLTTVLLLFPALFLLAWSRMGARRAARSMALIGGASVAVFLTTYFLYGSLTGLPVTFTFSFTWQSFATKGATPGGGFQQLIKGHIETFKSMSPLVVAWTGLVPWLLLSSSMALVLWRGPRHRDVRAYSWFVVQGVCGVATLYYCAQTMTFGAAPFKYIFVFWGLAVGNMVLFTDAGYWGLVTGSKTGSPGSSSWSRWRTALLAGLFLASFLAASFFLKDRMIFEGLTASHRWSLLGPALLVIAAVVSGLSRQGDLQCWAPRLAMLAVTAYTGLSFGVALHQARAPYSTTYDYGQSGFEETVLFLRMNTTENQVISSMKDIGYAAGRRYIENYGAVYGGPEPAKRLTDAIASGKVHYAVFTEGRGQDQLVVNVELMKWINENCHLVQSFGHYRVYERSGSKAAPSTGN